MHACMVHGACSFSSCRRVVYSSTRRQNTVRVAANVPHRLRKNPFPRTRPEYRPLMRPSFHSTDIIVGFLRVTQMVLLYVGV